MHHLYSKLYVTEYYHTETHVNGERNRETRLKAGRFPSGMDPR